MRADYRHTHTPDPSRLSALNVQNFHHFNQSVKKDVPRQFKFSGQRKVEENDPSLFFFFTEYSINPYLIDWIFAVVRSHQDQWLKTVAFNWPKQICTKYLIKEIIHLTKEENSSYPVSFFRRWCRIFRDLDGLQMEKKISSCCSVCTLAWL